MNGEILIFFNLVIFIREWMLFCKLKVYEINLFFFKLVLPDIALQGPFFVSRA